MKSTQNKSYAVIKDYFRNILITCLLLVMSSAALAATTYINASDSRFEYLGTWKTAPDNDDARYTIYPGSTIRIKIEGTVWLHLKHYNSYDAPHVRVRHLGQSGGTIYTVNNSIKLVANNGPVEYELIFTAIQGVAFHGDQHAYYDTSLYFKGLWLQDGSVLHHATMPDGSLRVEFLGDSITHGVRILKNDGDNVRSQDASQCFGYYLARALHAEYRVRGHSGESTGGLVGKVQYFKKHVYLDPVPDPDYFFINIGANDVRNSSSDYLHDLETLLSKVRSSFPNSYIYVLDFFNQNPNRVPQIHEAIASRAAGHASYFNAAKYIQRFADNIHPTGASHFALSQALAAHVGPAPNLISPINNVVVSKRPELDWTEADIAESYKIIIHRDGKEYLTTTVGAIDDWIVPADMPRGDYNWWVQARNSFAEFRWSVRGDYKILPYNPTAQAVLITPSGTIDPVRKPTLKWGNVERATDYYLIIQRNGKAYSSSWVKNAEYIPEKELKNGHYKWWVRPYNADGYGPWSDGMEFDISYIVPGKIDLIAPKAIQDLSPTVYEWQADSAATWYKLYVSRDGKAYKKNVWHYTGVTNGLIEKVLGEHPVGKYKWWIQAWGPDGLGPWSDPAEFSYGVPLLLTPHGNIPTFGSHEFSWTGDVNIPWYQLSVSKDKKNYANKWVQSTNWIFATKLPYGKYKWWVRSWKDEVLGSWSDAGEFNIGAVIPLQPVGEIATPPTELRWNDIGSRNAIWYQIIIHRGTSPYWKKWVKVEDTVDFGGDRAFTGLPTFTTGRYTWWIRAWNNTGMGPWSEGETFTVLYE